MKKFLVVLLSLGLIVAFGATASAADVKFGGSYYVVGVYDNNPTLADDTGFSRAYFYQRVRLQPVFAIAEGLTFTARMDALEKQWGNTNWKSVTAVDTDTTNSRRNPGGTQKIQENFEFERAYVTFKTAIAQFDVGYMSAGAWATKFGDNEDTKPRIKFTTKAGPVALVGIYEKRFEADTSAVVAPGGPYAGKADADYDCYYLAGIYGFKGGSAGVLYGYLASNTNRVAAAPLRTRLNILFPYLKATFGPVYVEAEINYAFGTSREFENVAGATDLKKNGWAAYALLQTNLGPAYFGAQVGWSAGWDGTGDTDNSGLGGGADWNPALILMNDEMNTWSAGTGRNTSNNAKSNMMLVNVFGGFNPTKQLNIQAGFTAAQVDTIPAGTFLNANTSKDLGYEIDVTASYKIYDNLTYMVGAGYLMTGDAFKGFGNNSADVKIGNDYILMNKLSLSF